MFGKEKFIVVKSTEFCCIKVPHGQAVVQGRYDRPQEKDTENDQGRQHEPNGIQAPFTFGLHNQTS